MFNMRLVLVFASVASALADPFVRSYHEDVGIPVAEKIRGAERRVAENQILMRIAGGSVVPANYHPYLAGLVIDLIGAAKSSVCGASLLTANRLVTAAHCWFDGTSQASQFTVVLGSLTLFSGGTRVVTQQVIPFKMFDPATLAHDIAMIYLPSNVAFSARIAPIALPQGIELSMAFEGQIGVAIGYGRTNDQQTAVSSTASLSHVALQIMSVADCQAIYARKVNEGNICTKGQGGVGVCGGDSGGPLVVNSFGRRVLVGVALFADQGGCQGNYPSGFLRVTTYINFIRQHL